MNLTEQRTIWLQGFQNFILFLFEKSDKYEYCSKISESKLSKLLGENYSKVLSCLIEKWKKEVIPKSLKTHMKIYLKSQITYQFEITS